MNLDTVGVGNKSSAAKGSSEFDTLQSQLDEFIEKETLDMEGSDQPESAHVSQQRLDEFVENLQQQMDEFSATHSENNPANVVVEATEVDPFSPEEYGNLSGEPACENEAETALHGKPDKKSVYPLLAGSLVGIAAILWLIWPENITSLQEELLVEEMEIEETVPETLVVAERVMQEERLHEEITPAAEPVDILLPELVVIVDVANLRSKPSTAGHIVMKLKKGAVLSQLDSQGDWFEVQLQDNSKAWAYKTIVTEKKAAATSEALQGEPAKKMQPDRVAGQSIQHTVTANIGNIRIAPGSSADVMIRLKQGAVVTQLKREGEWLQVRLGDGRVAWAHESIF